MNKNPKYERWRWTIFGVTWLAYAGFYLTRKAFSVAKNELKKPDVLGLTKPQMSEMDGAFSAAYAIGQFFWGTLGDRFGTRKVILFGMMASIVTAALMGMVNVAWWMGVLFALQGAWASFSHSANGAPSWGSGSPTTLWEASSHPLSPDTPQKSTAGVMHFLCPRVFSA